MKESQGNQTEVSVKQSSELSLSKSKENKEVSSIKQIEGIPMLAVKTEKGWIIACGKYRREKIYATETEAEKAMKKLDWENLQCFMSAIKENLESIIKNK